MAEIDTDRFRTILLEERQRVVDAISYLHDETPGSLEEETEEMIGSVDNHLAETASATLDREIDYTLEENSEHVLAEIDSALERIAAGAYGTCRTCGRPISEERLEAIPYATQCIDCKRREERG
jgi:RNA polymerase-binding protein DksA